MGLAEYRRTQVQLADYLPWAGLVAPGVVLDKDGAFQRTARFSGPDLDAATEPALLAVPARLNNGLQRLGSGWAIFVVAARGRPGAYPAPECTEPRAWMIDHAGRGAITE